MDVELEWKSRTPMDAVEEFRRFRSTLPGELEAAAEAILLRVEKTAARMVNVDTGRLRASIGHLVERVATSQIEGAVGTNVEYAPFQEAIDPYLRPAVEMHRPFIEQRVGRAIQNAWGSAT